MSTRPTQPWNWICEFCYRTIRAKLLPGDWDFVWQSAVCPECKGRVERDGGYAVVVGGAYASKSDPREMFTVVAHSAPEARE